MRNKMQEFRASTFSAALKRFRKYLNPDIIALVNHTRAQNIAKHAENAAFDYNKSRDNPKKTNIASTIGSLDGPGISRKLRLGRHGKIQKFMEGA